MKNQESLGEVMGTATIFTRENEAKRAHVTISKRHGLAVQSTAGRSQKSGEKSKLKNQE